MMRTQVTKTVSRCFAALHQVRRCVPASAFQSLVQALVISRLDYGNGIMIGLLPIWCGGWLLISERIKFKVAVLTYKPTTISRAVHHRTSDHLPSWPTYLVVEISDLLAPAASINHQYIVPPSAAEHFWLLAHSSGALALYRWWRGRINWCIDQLHQYGCHSCTHRFHQPRPYRIKYTLLVGTSTEQSLDVLSCDAVVWWQAGTAPVSSHWRRSSCSGGADGVNLSLEVCHKLCWSNARHLSDWRRHQTWQRLP